MRGRPREYSSRYPLTVSVERDLWDFASEYGILARDAISLGLQGMIENDLVRSKKIPPEEVSRYMEIKNREIQYLVSNRERETNIVHQVSEITQTVNGLVQVKTPANEDPKEINWLKVPEDRKVSTYIQTIMDEDFRAFWISKYNSSDEEDRFEILNKFADDVICRYKADENKPIKIPDVGDIRRALVTWADSARGFDS